MPLRKYPFRTLFLSILSLVVTLAACQAPAPTQTLPAPIPTQTAVPLLDWPLQHDLSRLPGFDDLPVGEWVMVEPGGETRCALDTDYRYWVKRGTVDKLMIYFEGGGGCWDAQTCAPNSSWYDHNAPSQETPARRSGILSLTREENPFRDYHMVFIPSCTGDVHTGSNVQTYPDGDGTMTVHHYGFINASNAVQWAIANIPQPESILVTGCSAGAVGSLFLSPYIIEGFPGSAVHQLGDSLAFVYNRPLDMQTDYHTHDNFPSWIPDLQAIQPGEFEMQDVYIAVARFYPQAEFGQYNTQLDSMQARFYDAIGGNPEDFGSALAAYLAEVHTAVPNFHTYTAEGSIHCVLPDPLFYQREVNGVRFIDWLEAYANGETVPDITCEGC